MKGSEHGATMHFQIENKGSNNLQSSLGFYRNNLHTLYISFIHKLDLHFKSPLYFQKHFHIFADR